MSRGSCASWLGLALATVAALVVVPAVAAPPPPGWEVTYRARACGPSPAATPIAMKVTPVSQRASGVRIAKSSPVTFAWAVDLGMPSDVRPVSILFSYAEGLLLLTDDGRWIVVAPPGSQTISSGEAQSYPVSDGARPRAATGDLDSWVQTIQQDGSTIAHYDLGICGFGARAVQSFRLPDGAQADVVASVDPNLGGIDENNYLFVSGRSGEGPGQVAFVPVTGDVVRPLGRAIVPVPPGETLSLLSELDIAGGCHGMAGFKAANGSTTLSTFCKPGLADRTILLAGDVGLGVVRKAPAVREPVTLAKFSLPVGGAAMNPRAEAGHVELLVLARGPSPSIRVIALVGTPADYQVTR